MVLFRDWLSARQLVSWFLGAASIGLAIEGFRLLRLIGRPTPTATRSTNLPFDNTTTLVTVGAYRFIRHPLYASLLALVWCAYLKNPLPITGIVLALGASGFLIATSIAEEQENLMSFGAAYAASKGRKPASRKVAHAGQVRSETLSRSLPLRRPRKETSRFTPCRGVGRATGAEATVAAAPAAPWGTPLVVPVTRGQFFAKPKPGGAQKRNVVWVADRPYSDTDGLQVAAPVAPDGV